MNKHVHIITHDIPYPPNYGGVVDLFYKIKALHEAGVLIHLHCFHKKGQSPAPELGQFCNSVNYYQRKQGIRGISLSVPYMAYSRRSVSLEKRLLEDNYPILFEGIQCCYLLHKHDFGNREIMVRLHNVEFLYYRKLANCETHPGKKLYYYLESVLLKSFERSLSNKALFIAVSSDDVNTYQHEFKAKHIVHIPVFLPWNKPNSLQGIGFFCLYHGNLEINENEKAAEWLLTKLFNRIEIPLVLAGKNPSLPLQALAHIAPHTCIVANPSDLEMQDLISKAQINIIPSFNKTGVKLKLLNALYNGRHCLVNTAAVAGTGLESICEHAETDLEFEKKAVELFTKPFNQAALENREHILQTTFNNSKQAQKIIEMLWKHDQ